MIYSSSYQNGYLFFIIIFLCIITCANQDRHSIKIATEWSDPVLLFDYPDSSTIRTFDADAYRGTVSVVQQQFDTTEGGLNYSRVLLVQQDSSLTARVDQLSSDHYPAEQPSLFRGYSDALHIFWGERRVDPDFEQWQDPMPFGLATSLIYTEINQQSVRTPKEVYKGKLSDFSFPRGGGELRLPAHIAGSATGRLYIVFGAEIKTDNTPNSLISGVSFLSNNINGTWNEVQLLLDLRFSQTISTSPYGSVVVPHIGAPPFLPGGDSNDLYVIASEDGGNTWNEEMHVFTGGEENLGFLYLESSTKGVFHLLWGQDQDSGYTFFPNVVWHSMSEDGGITWSEPEIFFDAQRSSQDEYHFIRSSDMVIDQAGRVHWAGVTHLGNENGIEKSELHYKVWDPESQSWSHSEILQRAENPGQVHLSIDRPKNNLYLFWDVEKERSYATPESMYYSVLNLGDVKQLPVISESGPLQIHANYPNPFSSSTTLPFTLEESGEVMLNVYDIGGRRIFQKNLGTLPAGFYQEKLMSEMLSSGIYIYELVVNGEYRQEEKMIVVK